MNAKMVIRAAEAAREFIRRAEPVATALGKNEYGTPTGRQTGALRRQSMELTRALADMRRPNNG